jgi:hypothetical protein
VLIAAIQLVLIVLAFGETRGATDNNEHDYSALLGEDWEEDDEDEEDASDLARNSPRALFLLSRPSPATN